MHSVLAFKDIINGWFDAPHNAVFKPEGRNHPVLKPQGRANSTAKIIQKYFKNYFNFVPYIENPRLLILPEFSRSKP